MTPFIIATLLLLFYCLFFSGCEMEPEETITNWTQDTFNMMSDDQKVGQLFCLTVDPIKYFLYPDYKTNINALIGKYKPGAVFLVANLDSVKMEIRNEFNGDKLHDEIIKLQSLTEIPLFVAANFESGAWYWDNNATRFPFPLALGATRSGEFAYRQGKITSVEAKVQGINWLFAPIVNTSIDPENTTLQMYFLGNDPANVSELASQFIKGCQETSIAACMKYFPNEKNLSLLSTAPEEIEPDQIEVFKACIDAGVLSVMGSPLAVTDREKEQKPDIPEQLLSGLLRNQLGFDGIIISNLNTAYDPNAAVEEKNLVLETLSAGNTMFLLPEILNVDIPLLDFLNKEVMSGNVDMVPVNAASRKIIEVKRRLNLHLLKTEQSLRSMAGIGLPEYYQNARDITARCITLLKNENNIIPVDYNDKYIVSVIFLDDFAPHYSTPYSNKLEQVSSKIRCISIFGVPDQRIAREVLRRASEADVIICSFFLKPDEKTRTPGLSQEVKNLFDLISKVNDKIIVVSFFDPYLINYLPEVQGYVLPYSPSNYSINSAVDVIFGNSRAYGKLPIYISEKYPPGFGLE